MTRLRWLRSQAPVWLLLPLALGACGAGPAPVSRTYFVDFDHGSDQASGNDPVHAWRHAPGDPEAVDNPEHARLSSGDVVLFKGGVVYRGAIRVTASGDAGHPISFRGEGFGPGKAILSGRDLFAATARPCSSTPGCANLPGMLRLRVVDMPESVRPSDQIAVNGQTLQVAQWPQLPDPFWYDDLSHYAPLQGQNLTGGEAGWRIRSEAARKALGNRNVEDLVVHLWGQPNAVFSVPVEAYRPDTGELTVVASRFKPYSDRDTRFALANHPALIQRPFEFATVAHGRAIVVAAPLPPGPVELEISRRPLAFNARSEKHIVIEGFEITGYAGGIDGWGSGAALKIDPGAEDIIFRHNFVHDLSSWAGAHAVQIGGATNIQIDANRFLSLWRGGGVSLGGGASDVRIVRNDFDHIGRTGIVVLGADRVWIDHNRLTGLLAAHGNAISIYLDNHDVLVSNNLVRGATRALTFHGKGSEPNRIAIRRNLLVAVGEDGSALQSWGGGGAPTRQVEITGNLIAIEPPGRFALRLTAADQELIIRNNLIGGLALGGIPTGWVFKGNTFLQDNLFIPQSAEAVTEGSSMRADLRKVATGLANGLGRVDARLCSLLDDPQPLPNWLSAAERAGATPGIGPDDICRR